MGEILIGTAGWSYDDWRGIVYPPGARSRFDRLAYLAGLVDTLEVNSSFYRVPSVRTVESWIRRTADRPNFVFSIKLHQGLTHQRDPDAFDSLVRQFHGAVDPLAAARKLAAVLVQFPWSFRCDGSNLAYLDRLLAALDPLPVAVEVRHEGWLDRSFLDELGARHAAFCNIDQPTLRQCLPPTTVATSELGYVRLHGRNAGQWFANNTDVNQRYNYLYSDSELSGWAGRIRTLADKTQKTVVYANNHFCGQAVANALQLKAILLNRKLGVPAHLVRAFPQIQEFEEVTEDTPDSPTGDQVGRSHTPSLFDLGED